MTATRKAPSRIAAARSAAKPARIARHPVKPARAQRVAAREPAASKVLRQRLLAARARPAREPARALTGGLRVTSVQTYVLPDGRTVIVRRQPRPEDVRDLVVQHQATFGVRRVQVSPWVGQRPYMSWYADRY
jgi:hypothetical protein